MKKILCFLFIFCILFLSFKKTSSNNNEQVNLNAKINNEISDNNSIKIAYFNVDPHVYLDEKTGEIKGAVYEMIEKHISKEMGIKFIWDKEPTNVPRQLKILETEKNYASAVLILTPDRQKKYNFTEKPYFLSQSAIAVLKNNKLNKISKIDDIIEMKIGYAQKNVITPFMKDERLNFDLLSDPNYQVLNYEKLLNNRLDAVYLPDKAALLALASRMNIENKIKVINLPENPSPFYIVFSKGSEDILEKYNKAFNKLNGQKLYLNILKKYLDTSKL